jgi:branched-chain amino acid transport system permease protein
MLDNFSLLYLAPALNLQLLLDGLFVGAIFALAAYGLALVWGVMNLKNLAQGDFVIMGGYIAWWLGSKGIHPLLGLPVAAVVMFGFGWLLYRTIICRVVDKDLFTSLLATFGLAIMLQQLLNLAFGPETRTANAGFETWFILGNQVSIAMVRLISLLLCLVLALGLVLFMKRSRMGQAIRATAQDPRAAKVMGIDTDRVYAFTFSLNAAICGVAGALISMIWVIQPFFGITHSIRSFVIVTAAGLGNLPGVIMAGFGLGIAEQFGGFLLGAEFQQAIVVGFLLVVLVGRQIQAGRHRQVVQ